MNKTEIIKKINGKKVHYDLDGTKKSKLCSAIVSANLNEDQLNCINEMISGYFIEDSTINAIIEICEKCNSCSTSSSDHSYDIIDAIKAINNSDMYSSDKRDTVIVVNKAECYLTENNIKSIIKICFSNCFSSDKRNSIVEICKSTIPSGSGPTHTPDELDILLDIGATIGSILSGRR